MAKANANSKPQALYNVKVESDRIKGILAKLSKEKPKTVETGGKKDVISTVKKEIMALIKLGYTAQQIADAIKTDSFDILPKTITEIANKAKLKKTTKKPKEPKIHAEPTNAHVEVENPATAQQIGNNDSGATDEMSHNDEEQNPTGMDDNVHDGDEESKNDDKTNSQSTESILPDFAVGKIPWNKIIYPRRRIFIDNKEKILTPEEFEELKPHAIELRN